MPNINGLTKQYLLSLPVRKFDEVSVYETMLLVPHSQHEESKYSWFAIVGLNNCIPVEIAAFCDVLRFDFSGINMGDYDFEMEMTYPENLTRYFSTRFKFKVHQSLSTTKVSLVEKSPELLAEK
jgi:hypothetical protein